MLVIVSCGDGRFEFSAGDGEGGVAGVFLASGVLGGDGDGVLAWLGEFVDGRCEGGFFHSVSAAVSTARARSAVVITGVIVSVDGVLVVVAGVFGGLVERPLNLLRLE